MTTLVASEPIYGSVKMTHYRFSANTGFLWPEPAFLEGIRRAAACRFEAVEFHDEAQGEDRAALKDLLAETALPVTSLKVSKGTTGGCAATPEDATAPQLLAAAERFRRGGLVTYSEPRLSLTKERTNAL